MSAAVAAAAGVTACDDSSNNHPGGADGGTDAGADGGHRPSVLAQFQNVAVGVALSHTGRTFLSFSRAIDETEPLSLVELVNGTPVQYPPGFDQNAGAPAPDRLLSVQALTVDAQDRLWILDTAKIGQAPITPGTPKLIAVDLKTDHVVQTITFPPEVAGATAMLNDVRIDLGKGSAGFAFLTDSATPGPNGLVVVDLATGASRRRLNDHPTTKPQPDLVVMSEGMPLIVKQGPDAGQPYRVGSDGIALDADGHHLYYRALTGHHLYRVSTDALVDPAASDADVAATIEDLGDLGFASDGLLGDAAGRLYLTDYENNVVHRRNADGTLEIVMSDQPLLWPDSLALSTDGTLIATTTQIERSPRLRGADQRTRPFTVWGVATDSQPLYLSAR
ncbi:MAG TPA: L-dopachrome tautomerase-related protein [Kofleriaceae bacterium]|nr:L-dopachrome tautomerase-related protein [Kofleriaceae bacterium]